VVTPEILIENCEWPAVRVARTKEVFTEADSLSNINLKFRRQSRRDLVDFRVVHSRRSKSGAHCWAHASYRSNAGSIAASFGHCRLPLKFKKVRGDSGFGDYLGQLNLALPGSL
jgi:hypothetical protein